MLQSFKVSHWPRTRAACDACQEKVSDRQHAETDTWALEKSPLAHAISYLPTKIIQLNASVRNCLPSIDNMCYYIAVLNGTDGQYVKGFDVPVVLQNQSNYICLHELDTEAAQDFEPRAHSDLVKQHITPPGLNLETTQLWRAVPCTMP